MESDIKTSPKFTELTLSYNDHPDVQPLPGGSSCANPPPGFVGYAYTEQNFDNANQNRAIICLCDIAFRFPSLDNIKKDVEATWEEGPRCKNMGSYDSGWMTSLGGLLLHEFTHYEYLLEDVPNYAKNVMKLSPRGFIDDYNYVQWSNKVPGTEWPNPPTSGYGPHNAMTLNDNIDDVLHMAMINADNYRWYAQSKWWSFQCEKAYGKPLDDGGKTGDKMRANLPA